MSEERKLIWKEDRAEIESIQASMKITGPTSAWDIMEWVIQEVKNEPRRLWMGTWGGGASGSSDNEPPCGTVACFAGWSNIRTSGRTWDHRASISARLAGLVGPDGRESEVEDEDEEGQRLKRALYYDLFVNEALTELTPGRLETVVAVEKRAREIMTKYEARLRATIIYPVEPSPINQ